MQGGIGLNEHSRIKPQQKTFIKVGQRRIKDKIEQAWPNQTLERNMVKITQRKIGSKIGLNDHNRIKPWKQLWTTIR